MDERLATFDVGATYQLLDVIGEGAYGVVWSVNHISFRIDLSFKPGLITVQPFIPLPNGRSRLSVLPLSTIPCSA